MFLTFESVDGLGKTTQAKLLAEKLTEIGHKVHLTKEPGDGKIGSNIGGGIRNLLFQVPTAKNMAPGVADLLFLADHIQNSFDVQEKIKEGYTVISDRYADSQFAYNYSNSKNAPEWVMKLYKEQYGYKPDVIIYLVASGGTEWALKRAKARTGTEAGKQDGKPWNDADEQLLIQAGYHACFQELDNVLYIPVKEKDSIETIHKNILNLLLPIIQRKQNG